eukprot:3205010-Prymnesium_polylepis.1
MCIRDRRCAAHAFRAHRGVRFTIRDATTDTQGTNTTIKGIPKPPTATPQHMGAGGGSPQHHQPSY